MTALLGMSSVALLRLGGRQVIEGRLTLGEFVAFMGYLAMLAWPTIAIGWVINIFQRGAASMSRILEILHADPEIIDMPQASVPEPIHGAVEFRHLYFQYPNAANPVLHDINLSIPAGTTLAIVGCTGSGKSTLVNLIPRLFDPPAGTIFIDGRDIRQWPLVELSKIIGFVPQETFLFSDTIRENIALGSKDKLSDSELKRAAQVSQIPNDIEAFARGVETFVGERGITLSGGQKQRVAISKAVVISPKILIFDDALSSVDTYTEERIMEQLARMAQDRTTIFASHRISTARTADQIIVLDHGRIVERGTHDSLMNLRGMYAHLYSKQMLEEELAAS